jgi:hypothetical protein
MRQSNKWISAAPVVYSDHQRLDARSLAMHCQIARKLLVDPALCAQARDTLARWRSNAPHPLPRYFVEWASILKRCPEEIAGFIVGQGEDAQRLRQSSPFAGLLSPAERALIYAAFR